MKTLVRKLTSRKLWLSVASFVSMLYMALGGAESEATQITSLIMAGATVIGYVLAEGLTDSSNTALEIVDAVEVIKEIDEG